MGSTVLTADEFRRNFERGWNEFQRFLATLTDEQMTVPTDAAGWTAKDHLIHLARWESRLNAMLQGEPQPTRMGVDDETWHKGVEAINADMQGRDRTMSLEAVQAFYDVVHSQTVANIATLTDADLIRPLPDFQPDVEATEPLSRHLVDNTYAHYAEHMPWIAAIAQNPVLSAED